MDKHSVYSTTPTKHTAFAALESIVDRPLSPRSALVFLDYHGDRLTSTTVIHLAKNIINDALTRAETAEARLHDFKSRVCSSIAAANEATNTALATIQYLKQRVDHYDTLRRIVKPTNQHTQSLLSTLPPSTSNSPQPPQAKWLYNPGTNQILYSPSLETARGPSHDGAGPCDCLQK